ncbi:MAG: hypothetical protein VKP62_00250 [Candidatus Sericytochromatia bacterium]|nr:hypothetical protein [Candidatus Sericytochromatia bacterium]
MFFSPARSICIAAAVVAPAWVAPATVAAAGTELGTPRFDVAKKAVVLPYFGAFPTFDSDALATPPRVYFDFKAMPRHVGLLAQAVSGSTTLQRVTMAHRPGGVTRLVLHFKAPTQVLVLNDTSRHQIVLVPQEVPFEAPAATPLVAPAAAPSKAPQTKVPEATRTFFQTFGHTDFKYSVGPRPKHAKHDQVIVQVGAQGVSEFNVTADPANDFVNFSISISGKGRPAPAPTPSPVPTPEPTPRPIWTPPPPVPTAIPTPPPVLEPLPTPSPEPSALPTPEPTPVPTPIPTPPPTPVPSAEPGATTLGFSGGFPYSVSESSQLHAFDAAGASVEALSFETRFSSWAYQLSVDHHRLEITDQQTSDRTRHDRDTYTFNTGLGYRLDPFGHDVLLGLGYQLRLLNTVNLGQQDSGAWEQIPAPDIVSVLTAQTQLFHGPTLFTRWAAPLFGTFGFDARLAAGYLFAALDVPADVGGLVSFGATPSLYGDFGAVRTSLGYDLHMATGGAGYNFLRHGPLARIEMRF